MGTSLCLPITYLCLNSLTLSSKCLGRGPSLLEPWGSTVAFEDVVRPCLLLKTLGFFYHLFALPPALYYVMFVTLDKNQETNQSCRFSSKTTDWLGMSKLGVNFIVRY